MTKKRKISGTAHASSETRRQELLDAAAICIAQRGFGGTTIDHIAGQAGLSKGSVYRFFASKDDVLLALLDRLTQEAAEIVEAKIAPDQHPLDRIRIRLRTMFEISSGSTNMSRVWFECYYHPIAKTRLIDSLGQSGQFIADELAVSGHRASGDPDQLVAISELLWAYHEGLVILSALDEQKDMLDRFDHTWPLIEKMLSDLIRPDQAL